MIPEDDKTAVDPLGQKRRELLVRGQTLGCYRIEGHLGSGGMGDVYLARQVYMNKVCALKVLPSELSASHDFEKRFVQESRALAMLDCPHIVRVMYADKDSERHYIAMEYVDGGSLDALIAEKKGAMDPDTVLRLVGEMLEGLRYAHEKKVIHRDLKPQNILLTRDGQHVRIADFGLALVAGEEYAQSLVKRSIVASMLDPEKTIPDKPLRRLAVGTIDYMSPEVREGGVADARSDVFALGVITYQMLTGKKPLGHARAPSKLVPGLPAFWDEWVFRCMEQDPGDRFQSAAEAAAALTLARPVPAAAAPVREVSPAGLKRPAWMADPTPTPEPAQKKAPKVSEPKPKPPAPFAKPKPSSVEYVPIPLSLPPAAPAPSATTQAGEQKAKNPYCGDSIYYFFCWVLLPVLPPCWMHFVLGMENWWWIAGSTVFVWLMVLVIQEMAEDFTMPNWNYFGRSMFAIVISLALTCQLSYISFQIGSGYSVGFWLVTLLSFRAHVIAVSIPWRTFGAYYLAVGAVALLYAVHSVVKFVSLPEGISAAFYYDPSRFLAMTPLETLIAFCQGSDPILSLVEIVVLLLIPVPIVVARKRLYDYLMVRTKG